MIFLNIFLTSCTLWGGWGRERERARLHILNIKQANCKEGTFQLSSLPYFPSILILPSCPPAIRHTICSSSLLLHIMTKWMSTVALLLKELLIQYPAQTKERSLQFCVELQLCIYQKCTILTTGTQQLVYTALLRLIFRPHFIAL